MLLLLLHTATAFTPLASAVHHLPIAPRVPTVRAVALPTLPVLAAACTVPTCLGFWKSEYGVSYAYGAATATVGALVLRAAPNRLAAAHALCVLCYGVRLNAFLLWRELNIPRFQKFRETIEERAKASGGRLKRTPFVLSCAFLYFCMTAPLLITSSLAPPVTFLPLVLSVVLAWAGFAIAAYGDLYKSMAKAKLGDDVLVTTNIFRFLRHPNYTGEQILWSANLMSAVAATCYAWPTGLKSAAVWLLGSVVGWAGIMFVLAKATTSLEKKQAERYDAYSKWQGSSWGGISLN